MAGLFNPTAPYVQPYAGATSELGQAGDTRGISGGQYPDVSSSLAPLLSGRGVSDDEIRYWYDALQKNADALKAATGWEKIRLQAEREDKQKALDNAMAIRNLDDQTYRYGIDQRREGERETLEQRRQEFNATHGLAVADLGLRTADTYTKYASTPDDLFQLRDLKANIGAASSGGYQAPLASEGQPHAKNWNDFAALSGFNLPAVQAGQSAGNQAAMAASGGASAGGGTDPRIKAMRAVADAIPPSGGMGHDAQDWAALGAIQNLYFSGRPGEVEKLDPIQQRESESGLRRLGWNSDQVVAQRRRSLPGQGAANAA